MDARIATIRIITGILQGSGSLSKLVPKYITKVIEADRALVQELSYGTLRYYPKLQLCLDFLLKKPFKQKDKDMFLGGVSIKRLFGLQHIGLNIKEASYTVADSTVININDFFSRWCWVLASTANVLTQ